MTVDLSDDERAALVAALADDRCEWGCAVTYTEATVRHDLAPAVERILATRLEPLLARADAIDLYARDMSRAGNIDVSVPLGAVADLMRQIAAGEV